jgi:transposase
VLAELARRSLVPEVWLPGPRVRAERERARFRLHLVKHRSALKNGAHAILFQHGLPNPHRDLFGAGGRCLLERLQLPEPWASTVTASLALIDELDDQIGGCERELRRRGAAHPTNRRQSRRRHREMSNAPNPNRKRAPPTLTRRPSFIERGSTVRVRQRACKIPAHGDFWYVFSRRRAV